MHVNENVDDAERFPVLSDPDKPLAPDHPPPALQAVAFVEFQDSVDEFPELTDDGLATNETVGSDAVGGGVATLLS